MANTLDHIDLKILDLLQDNGRITNARLAKEVGLSPPPMLERVRKLEKNGVIQKYVALVNPKKLDRGTVAFVAVSLRLHRQDAIQEFVAEIQKIPEILECYHIAGEEDYLLKIAIKDIAEYEKFLREKLTQFSGISKIRTYFILRTLKQETKIPVLLQPNE
jgi:Lrp/AsnC family leucine-responsive transcriptional regulator